MFSGIKEICFFLFIFRFAETTADFVLVPQDLFFITLFFAVYTPVKWRATPLHMNYVISWVYEASSERSRKQWFTTNSLATQVSVQFFCFFLYFGGWGVDDSKFISTNHFDSVKKISLNQLSLNFKSAQFIQNTWHVKIIFQMHSDLSFVPIMSISAVMSYLLQKCDMYQMYQFTIIVSNGNIIEHAIVFR